MAIICTSGAVKLKAGKNATLLSGADYVFLIDEAEAFISASSRYDWATNWPTISGTAGALSAREAVTSWAAINVIQNDMSGFTSRAEAQTMLDVLWSKVVECTNLIRDDNTRGFMQTGTID